jgi:hypothetical protein
MWNTVLIAVWILGWLVTPLVVAKQESRDKETRVLFGVLFGWLWVPAAILYGFVFSVVHISLFYVWLAKKI